MQLRPPKQLILGPAGGTPDIRTGPDLTHTSALAGPVQYRPESSQYSKLSPGSVYRAYTVANVAILDGYTWGKAMCHTWDYMGIHGYTLDVHGYTLDIHGYTSRPHPCPGNPGAPPDLIFFGRVSCPSHYVRRVQAPGIRIWLNAQLGWSQYTFEKVQ